MKRYYGEETVPAGIYFNAATLAFTAMEEAGRLPGKPNAAYRRVPAAALLVAGPILGAAYVMFLPVIGFAMLAAVAGRKGVVVMADMARAGIRVLEPTWEPTRAFLGRRKRVAEPEAKKIDAWAENAKRKLAEEEAAPEK